MERDVGQMHRAIALHISRTRADSVAVAESVLSSYRAITAALAPIIGRQGVGALQLRSVQLAQTRYPWIALGQLPTGTSVDLDALRAALVARPHDEAVPAGVAVLTSFCDLLTSLVGASLTWRLLDGVWPPLRGGDLTQEAAQ